jgi:hypothetical protein
MGVMDMAGIQDSSRHRPGEIESVFLGKMANGSDTVIGAAAKELLKIPSPGQITTSADRKIAGQSGWLGLRKHHEYKEQQRHDD